MRRARLTFLPLVSLATILVAVPAAVASKPGDKEHGVDRDKLVSKALATIEARDGIDVLKISKCGPQKRHGKLNFSTWICLWRAAGEYSGQVPYECAGKAVWKRHGNRWRVDPCANSRQPMAPLLDVANPPPTFGYNDNWIFDSPGAFNLAELSQADVARVALPWSGVEPTRGAKSWGGVDLFYDQLTDAGIKPLWVIIGAPCFAQKDPAGCASGDDALHPVPAFYGAMGDFAVELARRYPNAIGIEVWNEPNYPTYWGGPPDPDDYSEMLKTVADKVHAGAPGTTVVSAGLSPHSDNDTSGAMGFRDFLIRMYEDGAAQKADAIGIHPYPGVGPNQDYVGDVRVYLGKIQHVMDRYGDGSRPLWATEFGASTAGDSAYSPAAQAEAITRLYDLFRHVRGIDLAIVHRLVEDPTLPGREAGFGLVDKNLAPKPAFCQLAAERGVSIPGVC